MQQVQQATTQQIAILMVLTADHITGATGIAGGITVQVAAPGGSLGAGAGSIREVGAGSYHYIPAVGDFPGPGLGAIHATAAGCDPFDDGVLVTTHSPLSLPTTTNIPTASQNGAAALAALSAQVVDGTGGGSVTFFQAMKELLAIGDGNFVRNGDVFSYVDRTGSPLVTLTLSPTGRTRS